MNGSTRMTGSILRLTPAASRMSGSAVYYQPLPGSGLRATFTVRMSGGSGGDGLTFAMLDAARATVTSRGAGGGRLGFGGLPGIAVALATYPASTVGIVTGQTASGLVYAAKTTRVPDLRSGAHAIGVTVAGSRITVTVDRKRAVTASVRVPRMVLAAFTAGTGSRDDSHEVYYARISSGAVRPPGPGGGWSYNGSALMAGPDTRLTRPVARQAGTVIYQAPVASNGLRVRFNEQAGGGTGADGMTLALLNPATPSTARGADGAGLGYAGLPGVAVAFGTRQSPGYPSANFAAIAIGAGRTGVLNLISSVNEIGPLRTGTHNVEVTVARGVLTVYLDGAQILAHTVKLPRTVKLAFTGATGTRTDMHTVRDAAISAGAPGRPPEQRAVSQVPAPPPAPSAPVPTVDLLTSANFSEVLTDPAGMTLYRQIAPCTACTASYRPALLPAGQRLHKPPLLPGRLGTVRLPGGSIAADLRRRAAVHLLGRPFPRRHERGLTFLERDTAGHVTPGPVPGR